MMLLFDNIVANITFCFFLQTGYVLQSSTMVLVNLREQALRLIIYSMSLHMFQSGALKETL